MTLRYDADALHKFINQMPGLSTTMSKVIDVCNDPDATPALLKQVIALDPVLTGSVIRLVNSAYCGFPSRVTSLTRAIILLGVNTVKNMTIAISVLGIVKKRQSGQALNMDRFWAHSLAVGGIARAIAGLLNLSRPEMENHFVAGLLHDVGKLPLSTCYSEQYRQVLTNASGLAAPLYEIEKSVFGVDHCEVGLLIADKWRMDRSLCLAINSHHSATPLEGVDGLVRATVGLADAMAYQFEFGSAGNSNQGAMPFAELAQALGQDPLVLLDMKPQIELEIQKARVFLQLTA